MMMNEYDYGTMDESSSSYPYYSGNANDNCDEFSIMQIQEANDFAAYDQAMYDACYYDYQQQQVYDDENGFVDNYEYDDNADTIMWDDEQQSGYYNQQDDDDANEYQQEENHDDSALLRLILGVQTYLDEATTTNRSTADTPLMDLQYKMYTYMKQRAFELGMDTSSLY
ncbi:hypothetical protein BCR42DRAFT_400499 [Absidia repens]|uniref:Uncharacterized protein n=1 Tax=Absidia repens TaxID=90262 RepID=A0A1X2J1A3_9FUNG|nr:hypothetical protein BCR42DRAFT_400499 [Absidia repens]